MVVKEELVTMILLQMVIFLGLMATTAGQAGTLTVRTPSWGFNNENASLMCRVNTTDFYSRVFWRFGGIQIASYNVLSGDLTTHNSFGGRLWYQHNSTGDHWSALIIKVANNSDYGIYTCSVNDLSLSSGAIELKETSDPGLQVNTQPIDKNGIIKVKSMTGNVTFTASTNCSLPVIEMNWMSPNVSLPSVDPYDDMNCSGDALSGSRRRGTQIKATDNIIVVLMVSHPYYEIFQYANIQTDFIIEIDACDPNRGGPNCTCVMDFYGQNCTVCLSVGEIAGCVVGYLAGGVLIVCLIVFAVKSQSLSGGQFAGIVIGCLAGVALFIALTVFGANRKCLSGGEIAGFVIGCLAGCVPSVCLIVFAVKKWSGTAKEDKNHAVTSATQNPDASEAQRMTESGGTAM